MVLSFTMLYRIKLEREPHFEVFLGVVIIISNQFLLICVYK